MNIATRQEANVTIIELQGSLDATSAPTLREAFEKIVSPEVPQVLAVLRDVDFVDSSGLAALVSGMKRTRQNGGDLKLAELRREVRIIFELTRLDKAFDIHADESSALQVFSQ